MSIWALIQVVFNLICLAGGITFWLRLRRPPQDDPRLSRGLQLLQTKITVLEDLSDRTDNQVKQLTALLDQKTRMLQNKVLEAEQQIMKIDHSMSRSLEVAEIFQDKIPHQEIVERQQKVEYVRAARLAHSGASIDNIAAQVALPREQIELIAKFNREQLMFDVDNLPEWANRGLEKDEGAGNFAMGDIDFIGGLDKRSPDLSTMAQIDSNFRAAVQTVKQQDAAANQTLMDSKVAEHLRASVTSGMQSMQPAVMSMRATAQTLKDKLVSTAEDLLRSQHQHGQMPQGMLQNLTSPTELHGHSSSYEQPTNSGLSSGSGSPSSSRASAAQAASISASTAAASSMAPSATEFGSQPLRASEVRTVLKSQPTVRKVDTGEVKRVIFPRLD